MDFSLWQNAAELTENFALIGNMPDQAPFFGWEMPKLVSGITSASPLFRGLEIEPDKRIDITALWQSYLYRGKLWGRLKRAAPMMVLYILALTVVLPFFGHFPHAPIRGRFPFPMLIVPTIIVFLLLTFVVLDAILLHEGFLRQLVRKETYWPDDTFKRLEYSIIPNRPPTERDLADYWDISLIARRTEAVGNIIYYPFAILSLLIIARLSYFDDWSWTTPLIVALSLHFCLAFYAAWRLPKIAREYRDIVLRRLKRRRRQALMQAEKTPEAIDTMIEEVQTTHQGAFSYLWEQPAVRALLFPSGGIGLATLLQYLQH
jgi:protein-S-isoprenylcysteine O-methyltransferase Ste14